MNCIMLVVVGFGSLLLCERRQAHDWCSQSTLRDVGHGLAFR
jgi:hypothetical protein